MEHVALEREEYIMTIEGGKAKAAKQVLTEGEGDTDEGRCFPKRGLYTIADIEALPEGERAELIDGEMFMMAAPMLRHQKILMWLSAKIWNYIMEHGGPCEVLPAPLAVYIKDDELNYVEPDISVICDPNKLDEKGCHGAPDWVIEIVSPSSKDMDYERKRTLYEEAGVREYWIVDPMQSDVRVYNFGAMTMVEKHSFSDQVKAGIYEELFLDFKEVDIGDRGSAD